MYEKLLRIKFLIMLNKNVNNKKFNFKNKYKLRVEIKK